MAEPITAPVESPEISFNELKKRRKAGSATDAELQQLREYEAALKQKSRDAAKAQTEAGRRMASSRIPVDKDEADEILKERGLRDIHPRSGWVRKTIYRLSKAAAEHLGLTGGPNWYLLRYGYWATKAAMSDSTYVPEEKYPFENPNDYPDGEICTYLELWAMLEMESWKTPTKAEAARRGEQAVDQLVSSGEISAERGEFLKQCGEALQRVESGDVDLQWALVRECFHSDLAEMSEETADAIDSAVTFDTYLKIVSEFPLTSQMLKHFNLDLGKAPFMKYIAENWDTSFMTDSATPDQQPTKPAGGPAVDTNPVE